jgi:murein DD-endopeptidase MepM/ murein hydrolase activator NlpD
MLTIVVSPGTTKVSVHAFHRDAIPFRLDDHRWRALLGIDLDTVPGTYPVRIEAGGEGEHTVYDLVVRPRRFRTRRLSVDPEFVNPPRSAQARIDREAALLNEVRSHSSAERLWTQPFVRPVPDAATSAFGTRSVFNGAPRNPHGGADFMSPPGAPVQAPNAGRVVIARDLYFSGNTVLIDHGLGLFSMLAHLSAFDVHEGDRVTAGQIVGRVGATGRVTGPHLHWGVTADGARVDPLSVLALLGSP